jgi:hypothetical protein
MVFGSSLAKACRRRAEQRELVEHACKAATTLGGRATSPPLITLTGSVALFDRTHRSPPAALCFQIFAASPNKGKNRATKGRSPEAETGSRQAEGRNQGLRQRGVQQQSQCRSTASEFLSATMDFFENDGNEKRVSELMIPRWEMRGKHNEKAKCAHQNCFTAEAHPTKTSTRSVQLGRSKRAFACLSIANRAAKSTR